MAHSTLALLFQLLATATRLMRGNVVFWKSNLRPLFVILALEKAKKDFFFFAPLPCSEDRRIFPAVSALGNSQCA